MRDLSGGRFDHLRKLWNAGALEVVGGAADAEAGLNAAFAVEDGSADAAHPERIFFVIHGVAEIAHLSQFALQARDGSNGLGSALVNSAVLEQFFAALHIGGQDFTYAGGVQLQAPADP